jgi:short subunit dehydrogenase-like uncharacterized protein
MRDHEIVVFGATGFTGRLVVDYLARSADKPRFAIAGRDPRKLAEIAEHVRAETGVVVATIVAKSDDPASLRAMARTTQVVISTVGPFVLHGEPLVAACVDEKTDYVDITGEPEFVADIIERHDARARAAGVRLVPCCGFDSVPHDLGAFWVARELQPKGPMTIQAFVQAGGTISGGTWQSAVGAMSRMRQTKGAAQTIARSVATTRRVRGAPGRPHLEPEVGGWVLPMPTIDPAIVLRSAAFMEVFGPEFTYGHFVRVGALSNAITLGVGVGAVAALAQLGPTRKLLLRWKQSGEGPSAEQRARAYFRVTVVGEADGKKLVARVSGGDPGYGETSKMLSECALSLAKDAASLPARAGVLTPASAFEGVLVDRLVRAGIRFETTKTEGARPR